VLKQVNERHYETISSVQDYLLPVLIMYTSGTTGKPKGAVISHLNILQNVYAYQDMLDMDESESTVLAVPIFHITGLSCLMALFVYIGGLTILTPYFHADEVMDKMTEYKVTHFHAVPTVYRMLSEAACEHHNLSSLKAAVCGGGYISPDEISEFCQWAPNVKFHPAYGMTETAGAAVLFSENANTTDKRTAAGLVMPNVEIKIFDSEFHELPTGENGQICLRGAVVISHYLNIDTSCNRYKEWFLSGDIGHFDEDGYIYVVDRIKDVINRGGEKIFPREVENALISIEGIKNAVVFAVSDSLFGEVPAAAIMLDNYSKLKVRDIQEALKGKLAKYKVPVYIEFRNEFHCTASGKVQKNVLRDEFEAIYGADTFEIRKEN
ncbi:MAG: fatty acid--CoA ligase family protein, partial [Oscillospiraceae bacterium]